MMKQDRSAGAMGNALPLLVLVLACGVFAGCENERELPDLVAHLDDIHLAGDTVLHEAISEGRERELEDVDVDIRSLLSCDGEDALTCEVIEERFAIDPAYRGIFTDAQQLTPGGTIAAESLFDVHTHALRPSRFHLPQLRERLDRLASWQQGRAIVENAALTEEEVTWLSRVTHALTPGERPSRAELVTMIEGPGEGEMFPRRDLTVAEYRTNFEQVATAAQEVNDLLLFGVLTYARIQKLDYTSTESEDTLKERQLLYEDPEDPREEEVIGGPPRSRELLDPWRLKGIDDAEIDMEAVEVREEQLIRDRVAGFAQALLNGDVESLLADVEPQHEQYAALRAAFNRYRAIAAGGGWQTDPVDRYLREGSEGEAVLTLRQRLAQEGFDTAPVDNDQFDEQLKTAVLEFQESSQLPETGATDAATREALAIPARDRLAVLARALQQWRQSASRRSFGQYYVHVNIPAFHADVRNEGRTIYHYRVVVGKNSFDWSETVTETPTFSDRIERLVFNPFWHLPKSIIHNEVIPAVEENPEYIEDHNYEVRKQGSRIFIKQRPGPGNALGRVKFLFPNQFAVYMHDTPTRHLFSRVKRDFSHGCVRVHEPLELAKLLIQRDRQWTQSQIDDFIRDALRRRDEDTVLHLDTPVPIHLDYLLARVDEHGYVEFYDDVYDRESDALEEQQRVISEWLDIAI